MTWVNSTFQAFIDSGEQLTQSSQPDDRFVWRNFRTEERLTANRVAAYGSVENAPLTSFTDWHEAHGDYLGQEVDVAQPNQGLPEKIVVGDPATGASTFRCPDSLLDPNRLDPELHLVRVEKLDWVTSSHDRKQAREAFDTVSKKSQNNAKSAQASGLAEAILTRWNRLRDLRPVWAALRGDLDELLADGQGLPGGWENKLRDRLGLAHLSGTRKNPLNIVVFSYPIGILPTQGGRDRAITHPTVVDGPLNPYFCPSPSGSSMGWAVNLDPTDPVRCRELLHPPAALKTDHILAVGQIDSPPPGALSDARREHLLFLHDKYYRTDFSSVPDSDILP